MVSVDKGSGCQILILRKPNVALSNLRYALVTLSNLRKYRNSKASGTRSPLLPCPLPKIGLSDIMCLVQNKYLQMII